MGLSKNEIKKKHLAMLLGRASERDASSHSCMENICIVP